jgi:Carbohydrate binding domain
MKRTILTALVLFAALPLLVGLAWAADAAKGPEPGAPAANLVKNGDAETGNFENWTGWKELMSEGVHGGKHCFRQKGYTVIKSSEPIPVDPEKTYILSGWLKSAGEEDSKVYFGFVALDKDKKTIATQFVNAQAKTETTLAADCKKEDTVVKITDGTNWKVDVHRYIAFEVDDSGKYADLPNKNLSKRGTTVVEQKGDLWEVTMAAPIGKAYPAGTKIRQHRSGAGYMYTACSGKSVPQEWTRYTGKVSGVAASGYPANKWWPGTKYTKVLFLANYGMKKKGVLLADDISVTVEDK